jgi:hypothetical protein
MPTYIVTGPDGKKYKVSGQGSAQDALAHIQQRMGGTAPAAPAPAPMEQPAPAPERSGSILPISSTPDGSWQFDSNAGLVGMVKRALTLPGDVYTGKVQMTDPETGRTSDEAIRRSAEMAGVVTPVNPMVRSGDMAIPGVANSLRQGKVAPPSAEALRSAGAKGYDSVRNMGVRYNSRAVANHAATIRQGLEQDGILAELAPKTFKIIDKLSTPPAGSEAPLTGLIAARRALKNARTDFLNPTEKLAAERVIKQLDEFIGAADPKAVVAGAASKAGKVLDDANANYAASKRSDFLTGKLDKADRQAAVANSGLNIENSIRQRANDVLNSEKLQKGFTKGELAAIRKVAEGNVSRNTLRFVGNLLGGGGGLGAVISGGAGGAVGGMVGGPAGMVAGAAIPAIGMGAKVAGGRLARGAMQGVDAATRMRSPLYQEMLLNAPLEPMPTTIPSGLMRGGLAASPSVLDMLFQREKN